MPPSLATYQAAANAIYQPQQAAESAALLTQNTTTKNTLEAEKPQIQTDYQSAIDKLTQSVQDQTGKIAQLYSQRLGGNFSGLQGNDMGQMFARANEQQSIISQTEANKLAQITTEEGNADITYKSNLAALTPKYQSLEAQYAQSNYGAAVKDYQDQQYKQAQLQISEARLGLSAAKASRGSSLTAGEMQSQINSYKVKQLGSGNKAYTGPNGQTNLYQYAAATSGGDPKGTYQTILSELKTGSGTDKAAYNKVAKMSQAAGIAYLQKNNAYIFD